MSEDEADKFQDASSPESRSEGSLTPSSTGSISTAATSIADSELAKPVPTKTSAAPKLAKIKKEKRKNKAHQHLINHASGISTSVPLTGERPRPTVHSSFNDDVLMAIFEILHDDDPEAQGMTVKHICDILVKRHPEMAKLSSKTSNLVSAKLNAYVKRIEKADDKMKYALSRVWADTSPRRMVYVYRGILADSYVDFVQRAINKLRSEEISQMSQGSDQAESASSGVATPAYTPPTNNNNNNNNNNPASKAAAKSSPAPSEHAVSPASLQLRHTSPFKDAAPFGSMQFSVPYSSAPVTASLNMSEPLATPIVEEKSEQTPNHSKMMSRSLNAVTANSWMSLVNESESESEEDFYDMMHSYDEHELGRSLGSSLGRPRRGYRHSISMEVPSSLGKRSKSMSFFQSKRPRTARLTAAAATPRVPRKQSIAGSPSAAAAVAALRASALNNFGGTVSESVNSITSSIMNDTSVEPSISMKWLETVRSGFLNQDIENPENVSLDELDLMFA